MKSVLFLLLISTASVTHACRCPQQNLAAYFSAAEEVVMARLTGWETVAGKTVERLFRFELTVPSYKEPALIGSVSRVFLPAQGGEATGFTDVPARFVAQQLNGLAGLKLLRSVAAYHPVPDASDNDRLIGLLDVSGFSHASPVLLFDRPDRDGAQPRPAHRYDALDTREVAYETAAAVVYARIDDWYRLRLKGGEFAWLPGEYVGTFFPYDILPVRRLAHIRLPWHGFFWPEPGAGLPAYRETGEPPVWYYSRGC